MIPARRRFWMVMTYPFLDSPAMVRCNDMSTAVDQATEMAEQHPGEYVYILEAKQGYLMPKPEMIDFTMVDSE
jgi:hypothetical protein